MEFADFKKRVAGFMNRSVSDFTIDGVDLLTAAINDAKRWAERRHNFEFARTSVTFPDVSLSEGGLIANAEDFYTEAPVAVKVIETPFVKNSMGIYIPIDFRTRRNENKGLQRAMAAIPFVGQEVSPTLAVTAPSFCLVQHGPRIYLTGSASSFYSTGTTTVDVYADVVQWMPPYKIVEEGEGGEGELEEDVTTDFFLEFCSDLLLMRSVVELNLLLKEDDRVRINDAVLNSLWETVLQWDNSLVVGTTDDTDLD